jgi:hypothetical protein
MRLELWIGLVIFLVAAMAVTFPFIVFGGY